MKSHTSHQQQYKYGNDLAGCYQCNHLFLPHVTIVIRKSFPSHPNMWKDCKEKYCYNMTQLTLRKINSHSEPLTCIILQINFISAFPLTLRLLSYIYGAPSKARNAVVIYIWTYIWQCWKPSLSICCTMFQNCIDAGWFLVSQLCVNTLPATQVTQISHECISVISLESILCS